MARRRRDVLGKAQAGPDMSPMIDLVFLLLIFFMVASTAITYKKDRRVQIPVAAAAKVPELIEGRVVINIYPDGSVYDENSVPTSLDQVEQTMREARERNPRTRLHIRADREVAHEKVKDVIAASGRGGVNNVIFSTFVTDK